MTVQLAKIAGNQAKLDWLREQCEMRVIGLSFNYKLQWGSSKDEDIGTVEDLTGHLKENLPARARAALRRRPHRRRHTAAGRRSRRPRHRTPHRRSLSALGLGA